MLENYLKIRSKYKEGFIDSEIKKLAKLFEVNEDSLNKQMMGHTCLLIDGHFVMYHYDVFNDLSIVMGRDKYKEKLVQIVRDNKIENTLSEQ